MLELSYKENFCMAMIQENFRLQRGSSLYRSEREKQNAGFVLIIEMKKYEISTREFWKQHKTYLHLQVMCYLNE